MRLDVVLDARTSRLIAAARAAQAAEHLPKESARSLVALTRGTRLYLEANQGRLARRCLVDIKKLLTGLEVEDPDISVAFNFLVDDVAKAITVPAKAPAHTKATATPRR